MRTYGQPSHFYINGPGHMNKMAAMPIFGLPFAQLAQRKKLIVRGSRILAWSIMYAISKKVILMMTLT